METKKVHILTKEMREPFETIGVAKRTDLNIHGSSTLNNKNFQNWPQNIKTGNTIDRS